MQIFDCHRILGPIPTGRAAESAAGVLVDLDQLGIDGAAVTRAWELYGDPRGAEEYLAARGSEAAEPRLVEIPIIIPGAADNQWPPTTDDVSTAVAVRACPERHRFDLVGASAMSWWRELGARGTLLQLDASEVGLGQVAALAQAVPDLPILVLSSGYRELRRLRELLEAHQNVHVETGTIVSAGAIEWLARGVGAHRLLFGTGAPLWDDAGPRFQLDHLDLGEADVALLAGGSWDRLVGAQT